MKLATLAHQNRDGMLVVVSKDLTTAIAVPDIAQSLQHALDDWQRCAPALAAVYARLNRGELSHTLDFAAQHILAPLPRAYQWADGSAYVNHVELVRQARGATMPENFWHDPLMYQGGSDQMLGPRDPIPLVDENWGLDFEAEIAVITTDVPMCATREIAQKSIALVMLVNDISLRNLIPNELAKGFGFFQSKPATACSPVVVTPDELGPAWDGYKLTLPLITHLNGSLFGAPNAGDDMTFDFPTLIAHAAKTRQLIAGSIIGSGTVSNYDRSRGSSCIAEVRMLETIAHGQARTPFLTANDSVRIEMIDASGQSIFGAIAQQVVAVGATAESALV